MRGFPPPSAMIASRHAGHDRSVRSAVPLAAWSCPPDEPQVRSYLRETDFRVCVTAIALLRFLCEHLDRLPLGVMTRVLDTHDVLIGLVVLVENPPWTKRTEEVSETAGGGGLADRRTATRARLRPLEKIVTSCDFPHEM